MSARERDAVEVLDEAIKLLEEHRGMVRRRTSSPMNAELHALVSQAVNRAREARMWTSSLVAGERAREEHERELALVEHVCPTSMGANVWPADETFNDTSGRVCCRVCRKVLA